MANSTHMERILAGKASSQILPNLIALPLADAELEQSQFLFDCLKMIRDALGVEAAWLMQGTKGQWRELATTATSRVSLPSDLMGDVLDNDSAAEKATWVASPVFGSPLKGQLLMVKRSAPVNRESRLSIPFDLSELESTAAAFGLALQNHQQLAVHSRRVRQLESLLQMIPDWNRLRQTDQLLEQIAIASTQLLNAERATLFLPDATGTMLIGKPALGVEDGQLRVPIDAGVVGNVMQTGQPQRVDADISTEQSQISRDVDRQLGFQTKTLLCVPLKNKSGKVIGAFELINRLSGNFTDEDEAALSELASHAAVAIDTTQHVEHLVSSRHQVAQQAADQVNMIGQCAQIEGLKRTIRRVAATDLVVLITGENGTGKEVVAQMIHYHSERRDEVMVAVNCAAITETLLESELFGHEKGAFTDAHQSRPGKFELANGGSLFLDEIGDMSLSGQSKLLRVLEDRTVVRVGGSIPIPTSARMIAATNQNLADLVNQKKFRQDLFFRLNVIPIELPPLRERGDDILLLAEHFLNDFCRRARRAVPQLTAAAKKQLLAHPWPGNIRELKNLMERLAYLTEGSKVDSADLVFIATAEASQVGMPMDLPLTEATRVFQIEYIEHHIRRSAGNMTDAAQRMGLHRSNLYRKMKQLGINEPDGPI